MNKKNRLEVLSLLEAYRIKSEADREDNADHAIRVCQAIVANVFGYANRNNWTDDIKAAGLIDYGFDADVHAQYKALTNIVNNIKI
jgi:hypothetical protein